MFTRCPNCQTVHALNASLLAHAAGNVRCGACNHQYRALACLFDHWPNSDTTPPTFNPDAGSPLLGGESHAQEEEAKPSSPPSGQTQPDSSMAETNGPGGISRRSWLLILSALILATTVNITWTFREPLLAIPQVNAFLTDSGIIEQQAADPFRDISNLHLVSRDLHRHPTRTGMLALSITFVNRAQLAQPYPNIELILRDAANVPLATREFLPSEYLPGIAAVPAGLGPNVHVPVLLEFADPGTAATGFEINFR